MCKINSKIFFLNRSLVTLDLDQYIFLWQLCVTGGVRLELPSFQVNAVTTLCPVWDIEKFTFCDLLSTVTVQLRSGIVAAR
jgi:hypothetical protein